MRLTLALQLHDAEKNKNGLKNTFGDSYLLNHNAIFRNIRELTIQAGYRYSEASREYLMMPLSQLTLILKKKSIPYKNEVPTLRQLATAMPPRFSIEEMPILPSSNHFHESAHCIADLILKNSPQKNRKSVILNIILAESFANATEALSFALVDSETHYFFLQRNNYIMYQGKQLKVLRGLVEKTSLKTMFKFILISYVFSNFLYETISDQDFFKAYSVLLPELKMNLRDKTDFKNLFQQALNLAPAFRLVTTQFYFKSLGFEGSVERLLDFDFIKHIEKEPQFFVIMDQMSDFVVDGIKRR